MIILYETHAKHTKHSTHPPSNPFFFFVFVFILFQIVNGVHKVTLTINRVLKRHFNTTFILEVETEDNKIHTHPVRLTESKSR